MDEAADLAVRAQNGTASSALNNDNGMPGAALGLNTRGTGGNARLSPERKYRMRELATQKLSEAYRLDEVAASVATMQSASTLDTVASLVLQRSPASTDAKYVHFFHEKIPSRMMAEYTPLTPLDEIIAREPGHAAPLRTRALTKIFKEDFLGAAQDLTEALALCRMEQARHTSGKNQLISMKTAREEAEKRKVWTRDWMQDNRVADDDQPRGLELQILFQRGNQWLTVACQHVHTALRCLSKARRQKADLDAKAEADRGSGDDLKDKSITELEAYQHGFESRELVRKYAKRALRDYTAFISQLDYAYAAAHEADVNLFNRDPSIDHASSLPPTSQPYQDDGSPSQALVRRQPTNNGDADHARNRTSTSPEPSLTVHDIATLLSAAPPSNLPPFPAVTSSALTINGATPQAQDNPHHHEMITYHPLMPEILHSLLLTHCLLQTPPTTLNRIATNAARLARLADGYPFFLSARSPARADWVEILRKTNNWIGLAGAWDGLCKANTGSSASQGKAESSRTSSKVARKASGPKATPGKSSGQETDDTQKDRIHKEAVMEALGDERVVDDESFQKAVNAREKRAWRDVNGSTETTPTPEHAQEDAEASAIPQVDGVADTPPVAEKEQPRSSKEPFGHGRNGNVPVAKDEEYLIGTERADAIAKWVLEAPVNVEVAGKTARKKKRGKKRAAAGPGAGEEANVSHLQDGFDGMSIGDGCGKED